MKKRNIKVAIIKGDLESISKVTGFLAQSGFDIDQVPSNIEGNKEQYTYHRFGKSK